MLRTLAIFSPAQHAYSETFIQAHRQLPYRIQYFYDGYLPAQLEGSGNLQQFSLLQRLQKKLDKQFSQREWALINALKKDRPCCVLAEYGPTAAESLAVLQHLHIPLIVHFHGYDASVKSVTENYAAAYKKMFDYACKLIVVSKKMWNDLLQLGCPEEKLLLSVYGPDAAYAAIQPTHSKSCFVAVGRFVAKKAPGNTIRAFAKVVKRHPQASLVMVGEGALLDDCKTLCESLGITTQVKFAGVCPKEDIQKLFETALAFVQHSVTAADGDSEGTPVAVLEAQAAGLPVIATRHAGIPDVVLHNDTGLLVDEHDIDGMATAMIKLLDEPTLARQMGERGKLRIAQHFTLAQHLATITACIESCTNRNAALTEMEKQVLS